MNRILSILIIFVVIQIASNVNAGQFEHVLGETYPIHERHPTEEIKEISNKIDWKSKYSKVKELKFQFAAIARATRNREYVHEILNSIEMDVTNPTSGEILYPKGYTFNPLDFIKLPKFIIISNHKKDIEWLEKQDVQIGTMILTIGDPFRLSKKLNRKVMILKDDLKEKLKLEFYPAIAQQVGNKIKISEYHVSLL